MSRTHHHRTQRHTHNGHDYGARYRCNKTYGAGYGPYGRELAHSEMRNDTKAIVRSEIDNYPEEKLLDEADYAYFMYYDC